MTQSDIRGATARATLPLVASAFVIAALLNLFRLGAAPLADTTEARHAEVGREFAEDGHWLVPSLNCRPHLTKPPLTDWLVAVGILTFGENEFGARFGNALVAALGLALAAGFAARVAGRGAGIAAATLYFLTPMYQTLCRTISIDILLTVPVTAALWAVWEAARGTEQGAPETSVPGSDASPTPGLRVPTREPGSRLPALIFWLAVGVGAFAKGHIIALLLLLPVAAWLALGSRKTLARRLCWPPAVALGLAVSLSWFVYIALKYPGWLTAIMTNELGQRTLGEEFGSANFGLSIAYLLAGALPCIPLLLLALFARPERAGRLRDSGARSLLLLAVGLPLTVFSLVRCQRMNYVAPLMPAVSILSGATCAGLLAKWPTAPGRHRAAAYAAIAVLGLVGTVGVAAPFLLPRMSPARFAVLAATGCLAVLSSALSIIFLRRSRLRSALAALGLLSLAFWGQAAAAAEEAKATRSAKYVCGPLLGRPEPRRNVVLYRTEPTSANFYLRGPLLLRGTSRPGVLPGRGEIQVGRYPPPRELDTDHGLRPFARKRDGAWLILAQGDRDRIHRMQMRARVKVRVLAESGDILLVRMHEVPDSSEAKPGRVEADRPLAAGALDALIRQLGSEEPSKRESAARRLSRAGPAAAPAAAALVRALADREQRVRALAARALGGAGVGTESVRNALAAGLEDSSPGVRNSCARALGELDAISPAAVDALMRLAGDEHTWARTSALWALGRAAGGSKEQRDRIVALLIESLQDPASQVRAEAVRSLGRSGAPWEVCGERLLAALSDDEYIVREGAADVLGGMNPPQPAAVRALSAALRDEDWDVRAAAARALGKTGPAASDAVPDLVKLAGDRYWRARMNALQALCAVAPGAPATVAALEKALADKAEPVRRAARELMNAGK